MSPFTNLSEKLIECRNPAVEIADLLLRLINHDAISYLADGRLARRIFLAESDHVIPLISAPDYEAIFHLHPQDAIGYRCT